MESVRSARFDRNSVMYLVRSCGGSGLGKVGEGSYNLEWQYKSWILD